MDEEPLLDELKSLICFKAGLNHVTPADCKRISIDIRKEFDKNVSETTLKRLFGFAAMKFTFSRYTITALCEYAGKPEYIKSLAEGGTHFEGKEDIWKKVSCHADRITRITLKNISCRSGLPYQATVSRVFAEHAFEEFCDGRFNFMAFVAPPGYGKTILLSQLVDKYFSDKEAIYKGYSVLFVKAKLFLTHNKTKLQFENQLKALLGFANHSRKLFDLLSDQSSKEKRKLILIIDDYNECLVDFMNRLIPGFMKIILSVSPEDWKSLNRRLKIPAYVSPVPLLNQNEVDQICSNLGVFTVEPELFGLLKFPFYMPFYYQFKMENKNDQHNRVVIYQEVIARFIKEKIYQSNNYTEKILFLKKLVQQMGYGVQQDEVNLDLFGVELMVFKNAYDELLIDGILVEDLKTIRFLDKNVFEYFLFIELLEQFNLNADLIFLRFINRVYGGSQREFALLKWSIRYMVKTGNPNAEEYIYRLELEGTEKKEIKMLLVNT
ncbi:hypothetical protein DBR11_15900 [Pedobacter sp. HMWF019]|uniref:ATP-binding protein n=1 Tax=Pedobacter sp. HMWF019 TaxID=2056856 RepID=UPI000D374172|nr:ATP-binding protein [Pedobacter sp. HMWF019]PTS98050.1 hypothetical protein DBR11_15900 [Pedobacter sp. HMWF019]